jgi:hypothetical protein
VPATRRLSAMRLYFSPAMDMKLYRPRGSRAATVTVKNKEWAEGRFEGPLTYTEIIYPLAGLFGITSTAVGTNGAYSHVAQPSASAPDLFKTFTVECGDATSASQTTFATFRTLEINLARDECRITGNTIGQRLQFISALTSGATPVPLVPVTANDISVYLDSTSASIGTTKLTDVVTCQLQIAEKFRDKWVLDAALPSFKELVDVEYDISVTIAAELNAQMRSIIDALRSNSTPTRYLRIQATGPIIGGSDHYSLRIDLPVKLKDAPQEQADLDNTIYGYEIPLVVVNDADLGLGEFEVINTLTGL